MTTDTSPTSSSIEVGASRNKNFNENKDKKYNKLYHIFPRFSLNFFSNYRLIWKLVLACFVYILARIYDDDDNKQSFRMIRGYVSQTKRQFLLSIGQENFKNKKPIKTKNYQKSNIRDSTLKHIDIIDHSTGHIKPNLFADYHIVKNNASSEFNSCLLGESYCHLFPETDTGWPKIPFEKYKSIIKDADQHTSKINTVVELKSEGNPSGDFGKSYDQYSEIILEITAKNYRDQSKSYGGDFILARLVPSKSQKFVKYYSYSDGQEKISSPNLIIPGHVHDYNNGKYKISIPAREFGKFRLEVFLMRSSEACSAIIYSMNTIHKKVRVIKGIFEDGSQSELCGSFLPDMLPGGDLKNICNFTTFGQGQEYYCEKPLGWRERKKKFQCGERIVWSGDHTGRAYRVCTYVWPR